MLFRSRVFRTYHQVVVHSRVHKRDRKGDEDGLHGGPDERRGSGSDQESQSVSRSTTPGSSNVTEESGVGGGLSQTGSAQEDSPHPSSPSSSGRLLGEMGNSGWSQGSPYPGACFCAGLSGEGALLPFRVSPEVTVAWSWCCVDLACRPCLKRRLSFQLCDLPLSPGHQESKSVLLPCGGEMAGWLRVGHD